MSEYIDSEKIIEVIKSFLSYNEGDEASENLIISIASEILNASPDKILEIIQ